MPRILLTAFSEDIALAETVINETVMLRYKSVNIISNIKLVNTQFLVILATN